MHYYPNVTAIFANRDGSLTRKPYVFNNHKHMVAVLRKLITYPSLMFVEIPEGRMTPQNIRNRYFRVGTSNVSNRYR